MCDCPYQREGRGGIIIFDIIDANNDFNVDSDFDFKCCSRHRAKPQRDLCVGDGVICCCIYTGYGLKNKLWNIPLVLFLMSCSDLSSP